MSHTSALKILLRTAACIHWQPKLTACHSSLDGSFLQCSAVVADVCDPRRQGITPIYVGWLLYTKFSLVRLFAMKLSDALTASHPTLNLNGMLRVAMLCGMYSTCEHKTL